MGVSEPLRPIILIAMGGLLLGLTVLLIGVGLDLDELPAVVSTSALGNHLTQSSPASTAPSADSVALDGVPTPIPEALVLPTESATVPVPEESEVGTPTVHLTETTPSSPELEHEKPSLSPTRPYTVHTSIPEPDAWQRVEIAELELSFEAPDGWYRQGEEWAWSPFESTVPRVGFVWGERKPPVEMLPGALSVLHQEGLNLGWTVASSFRLVQSQGEEIVAAEWHVVVEFGDEYTGDFYASGRSMEELASIEPVLSHSLTTIAFRSTPGGPVETSIDFLSAVMRDPAGDDAQRLLDDVLQEESPLRLLGIDQTYSSFLVTLLPVADGRIAVQATLNYPDRPAVQRVLFMVQKGDAWRIGEISSES